MASRLKPRWTFPLNFRAQDSEILQDLERIAKEHDTNITTVMRCALQEYVLGKKRAADFKKIDEFLDKGDIADTRMRSVVSDYHEILSPDRLKQWQDEELLSFARAIRGRKFELEAELKKRGYLRFAWE
jgi:hypothetical protein